MGQHFVCCCSRQAESADVPMGLPLSPELEQFLMALEDDRPDWHRPEEDFAPAVGKAAGSLIAQAWRKVEGSRQKQLREDSDELEARALRAEAEAEEARDRADRWQDNVERWQGWADEQQLRELTLEAEHMVRLKQVRQEVQRHFEEARRDLVDENRALKQRILELEEEHENRPLSSSSSRSHLREQPERSRAELEAELEQLHAALERTGQKEEQRQELEDSFHQLAGREADVARAEADTSITADELAHNRAQLEAEWEVLRAEQDRLRQIWYHECHSVAPVHREAEGSLLEGHQITPQKRVLSRSSSQKLSPPKGGAQGGADRWNNSTACPRSFDKFSN